MHNFPLIALRKKEKVDEMLFDAYSQIERKNINKALSLCCSILLHYEGDYAAIKILFNNAKKNKILSKNFVLPSCKQSFLKRYYR
jgi:hypothetical protein